MIKHVILWKIKDDLDKVAVAQGVKEGLEGLVGVVPGLTKAAVITEGLDSSTADVMLDSEFESVAALNAYKNHPAHVAVADGRVRPYMEVRLCMDYEA